MAGGFDCGVGAGWLAALRDSGGRQHISRRPQGGVAGRAEYAADRLGALWAVHAAVRNCVAAAAGRDSRRGGYGEEEDLKSSCQLPVVSLLEAGQGHVRINAYLEAAELTGEHWENRVYV